MPETDSPPLPRFTDGGQAYVDAVARGVVIFDGAMGTSLQEAGLTVDDFGSDDLDGCNEILGVTRPDVVRSVHDSFFEVGVDVIETNTFGGNAIPLSEYDLEDRVAEINLANTRIARESADHWTATTGQQRFVAGSMGPGTKFPSLGQVTFDEIRTVYAEQAVALLEGGVDVLVIETSFDLLQVKAAFAGCKDAMATTGLHVPIQTQVTIELTGRMLPGTEIAAALAALEPLGPAVIGLNCATGPEEMNEHLRHLSAHSRIPISCIPNAGLPSVVDGAMHYDLSPEQLATYHRRFVEELGVSVIGGCCGTTPEHLRHVVEAVRGIDPAPRIPVHEPGATSIYSHVPFDQDTSLLLIGERTNANGSKKFRDAMLDADIDTCVQMAKDQVKEGAHVIDLCVDYVGRDGAIDMDTLARELATQCSVPIVLDSTEPEVLEAGLKWLGGRAILNSANLEEGDEVGKRMDRVFRLAQDYGTAVICLLIDEEGQARDVEWKLRVAHRLHDIATNRYGLDSGSLIFDALTFPLSTGDDDLRRDAMATMEAITRIKAELPGVFTTLGVSNVSFGLNPAARHVLNSVFMAECQKAGLDSAIVHAGKIVPLSRIPDNQRNVAEDLIWDRRGTAGGDGTDSEYDPLIALLEAFEGVESIKAVKEDRSGWAVEDRLEARIIDAEKDGLIDDLDLALESHGALVIVNDMLLAGMKTVGELFGSGEMQLPFVLQSAETMKIAVAHLEPHMERLEGESGKGTIVLATVRGDVHDIGKNLVDIILTNNGFDVHNLGIKVSIADMIDKAVEVDADAIGMSGLLVKSTLIMRDNLSELNERNLDRLPVLLGGAALTRTYVEKDLRSVYNGRLFYGKDAFEGLSVMENLVEIKRTGVDDPDFGRIPTGRKLPDRPKRDADDTPIPDRSPDVVTDNEIFVPPFLGNRIVKGIALDDIAEYINETALFRNQWQFRPESDEDDPAFKDRLRHTLREQLDRAKAEDWLVPQIAYGYFPANGDGNDLIIWTDESRQTERMRFSFPRQRKDPFLCIADFFRPVDSGEVDYAAFHLATVGARVSELTARLFAEDRYTEYLLVHGLGTEMAEALAEFWHRRIREEWGFVDEDGPTVLGLFRQKYRGGRYSFGYPACPELEDNARIGELLEIDRIGIVCDEESGWQYQPEQTTSALICHHPRAKYFVAR